MKRLTFFLLAFTIGIAAFAQTEKTVTGTISDEQGKPVKGIKLSVQYTKSSNKSDKQGRFTLKDVRPGDNIILEVGKKEYTQFLTGGSETLTLTMAGKSVWVETADGTKTEYAFQPMQKVKRSSTVITSEMIARFGSQSLIDVLKNYSPGIRIATGEDGSTQAYLRGQSSITLSSDALVILDGSQMSFDQALGAVDVPSIEKIEVDRSGAGYGVKGASGVIKITMKR